MNGAHWIITDTFNKNSTDTSDMADSEKKAKANCRIKVTKNGPYLVEGSIPLSEKIIVADSEGTATAWQEGKPLPQKESYLLCRCGQSNTKPFCDGAHEKVNFNGEETATYEPCLKRAKEFDGPTLKLSDVVDLCASARFCHRAGGIWKLVPESANPDSKKIALEEACDCPSGRLVLYDKEKGEVKEPNCEKTVAIIEDPQIGGGGPIRVLGGVPVESAEGKNYEIRNRVTLCRCGKSKNKPFCDSSHYPE
jgi:CDGSH-type Zn-finger protein